MTFFIVLLFSKLILQTDEVEITAIMPLQRVRDAENRILSVMMITVIIVL